MEKVAMNIPVPVSVAAGAAVPVHELDWSKTCLSLDGVGTGSYRFQASVDGTHWHNVGAALTADAVVSPFTDSTAAMAEAMWVRMNVTAYTSGTPTATSVSQRLVD